MNKKIELQLLYEKAKKLIKSLKSWQVLLYKKYSTEPWKNSNSSWKYVEWKKTIESDLEEAQNILIKYNSLRPSNLPIISTLSFKIDENDSVDDVVSIIIKVRRTLEDAYNALSIYIEPQLSEVEKQEINSLRKELEEMENEGYDELLIKNLKEALKEIENNHYLASSMIAARIILYCIEQIEGKKDEDKAEELTAMRITIQGENSKETKKWFIKAVRSARNSISHKITFFPSASDSFSILGDSFKMVKILHKYFQVKK